MNIIPVRALSFIALLVVFILLQIIVAGSRTSLLSSQNMYTFIYVTLAMFPVTLFWFAVAYRRTALFAPSHWNLYMWLIFLLVAGLCIYLCSFIWNSYFAPILTYSIAIGLILAVLSISTSLILKYVSPTRFKSVRFAGWVGVLAGMWAFIILTIFVMPMATDAIWKACCKVKWESQAAESIWPDDARVRGYPSLDPTLRRFIVPVDTAMRDRALLLMAGKLIWDDECNADYVQNNDGTIPSQLTLQELGQGRKYYKMTQDDYKSLMVMQHLVGCSPSHLQEPSYRRFLSYRNAQILVEPQDTMIVMDIPTELEVRYKVKEVTD